MMNEIIIKSFYFVLNHNKHPVAFLTWQVIKLLHACALNSKQHWWERAFGMNGKPQFDIYFCLNFIQLNLDTISSLTLNKWNQIVSELNGFWYDILITCTAAYLKIKVTYLPNYIFQMDAQKLMANIFYLTVFLKICFLPHTKLLM